MEIEPDNLEREEKFLLDDPVSLSTWLKQEIASFKERGMVAE